MDPADYRNGVACPAYGAAHVVGTTSETFDSSGRKLTETDADGDTTSYSYTNASLPDAVTSETDPDGATTTYTYNQQGQATATTVTFGSYAATTLDAYDANGRKYCEVQPYEAVKGVTCPATPPSSVTPGSDPDLGATLTVYDTSGRVIQSANPIGGITDTSYDSAGNAYCTVAPQQTASGVTCPATPPSTAPTPGNDPYLGATITPMTASTGSSRSPTRSAGSRQPFTTSTATRSRSP